MIIKHTWGYNGSEWVSHKGETVKLPNNFYAIDYETGKGVIVISEDRVMVDMSSSWIVSEAKAYDKDTLKPLEFDGGTLLNKKYLWLCAEECILEDI